jgi:hypothetical protein
MFNDRDHANCLTMPATNRCGLQITIQVLLQIHGMAVNAIRLVAHRQGDRAVELVEKTLGMQPSWTAASVFYSVSMAVCVVVKHQCQNRSLCTQDLIEGRSCVIQGLRSSFGASQCI